MDIYRRMLPSLGGYIANQGKLDMARVDVLLSELGQIEDEVFRKRIRDAKRQLEREKQQKAMAASRRLKKKEGPSQFVSEPVKVNTHVRLEDDPPGEKGGSEGKKLSGGVKAEKGTAMDTSKEAKAGRKSSTPTPTPTPPSTPLTPTPFFPSGEHTKKESTDGKKRKLKEEERVSEEGGITHKKPKAVLTTSDPLSLSSSSKSETTPSRSNSNTNSQISPSPSVNTSLPRSPSNSRSSPSQSSSVQVSGTEGPLPSPPLSSPDNVTSESSPLSSPPLPSPPLSSPPVLSPSPALKQESTGSTSMVDDEEETGKEVEIEEEAAPEREEEAAPGQPATKKEAKAFDELLKDRVREANTIIQEDAIRLGDDGWKSRYYLSKMEIDRSLPEHRAQFTNLLKSYTEGLAWVMAYYYEGCVSWSWFYPFHYAPMASDLRNIERFEIKFEISKPFSPISQLMGVLPSLSAHCMPPVCQDLMCSPNSPIYDFYPLNFKIDMNGKRYAWQAVVLLPLIDEKRLLSELAKAESQLTVEEKERNSLGPTFIFMHATYPLANSVCSMYLKHNIKTLSEEKLAEVKITVDTKQSEGLFGFISPTKRAVLPGSSSSIDVRGMDTLKKLKVVSGVFIEPSDLGIRNFLLPGSAIPSAVLSDRDLQHLVVHRVPSAEQFSGPPTLLQYPSVLVARPMNHITAQYAQHPHLHPQQLITPQQLVNYAQQRVDPRQPYPPPSNHPAYAHKPMSASSSSSQSVSQPPRTASFDFRAKQTWHAPPQPQVRDPRADPRMGAAGAGARRPEDPRTRNKNLSSMNVFDILEDQ